MTRLIINGTPVEASENATLLETATGLGIQVPTLCHLPDRPPLTSCMICVVEDTRTGRLVPACAARVEEGMVIETDSEAVLHARRTVLEMMLSEHVGDCEAPCERACPAGLNIPLMLRLLERGDRDTARTMARQALVMPAALGRVCTAPCEAGCRRGALDDPVAIRDLHGFLGETGVPDAERAPVEPSGRNIAVIGASPAGLAAAFVLRGYGHACRVYEKQPQAGGKFLEFSEEQLPRAVLDKDIAHLVRSGIGFVLDTEAGKDISFESLVEQYDAVVVACPLDFPGKAGVFHAEEKNMPVRSVASGKRAADNVQAYLIRKEKQNSRAYNSIIGRLQEKEAAAFAENRLSEAARSRPRDASRPEEEAARCLHCDCHAPVSCKLRQYATTYGARSKTFRNAERPLPRGVRRYGDVIFDVGKCIKCGICIEITRESRAPCGMSFTGRGFTMEVTVPFDESLEKALAACASECVARCPTGALAFETLEERLP
ncbi:MAG: NAD(P)-binding protein [Candidatus Hydrogenedentes bacterium]|nr:NAD(P)-binding protein [Candidatus Hydrogenedentota bacterium]